MQQCLYKPKYGERERNSLGNLVSLAPLWSLLPPWRVYPSHCFPLLKGIQLEVSCNHPTMDLRKHTLIDGNKKNIKGFTI